MYTTEAAIALRLSTLGVELRADDDHVDAIADCIAEATSNIDAYLGAMYSSSVLAANAWVQYCARAFAVYFVCIRRNEPAAASAQAEYDRYLDTLKGFAAKSLILPGVPSHPGGIVVSNQHYDLNRADSRVDRRRSNDGITKPRRDIDYNG